MATVKCCHHSTDAQPLLQKSAVPCYTMHRLHYGLRLSSGPFSNNSSSPSWGSPGGPSACAFLSNKGAFTCPCPAPCTPISAAWHSREFSATCKLISSSHTHSAADGQPSLAGPPLALGSGQSSVSYLSLSPPCDTKPLKFKQDD